jgi:hypothetical protein
MELLGQGLEAPQQILKATDRAKRSVASFIVVLPPILNGALGYRPPAPEAIEIRPPAMNLLPMAVAQALT